MSVFTCKMCGGTLEIQDNKTVAVCEYCGTKQTLPKLNDDRRAQMYDRANHFRRSNDYDKAAAIYEQILNEDGTDAEAYWSLVLCRYGIEYVEDPATHKRVPTVNRAQFTSIYMDEDYKSALQYADGYQKQIYEEEAKTIDDIQKGILEISAKEEPFDVFICYKETDANGRRTPDSVLANDLYHQLTQEGFKVFFSRITLEDKLGTEYEPYIFAALNSAKVMVVLGTKPEYFNAVWVKNEWSRYLSLVKQSGGKKMLIPAYKDMDPYDLPNEFSHLQAQDMSKLGFMQDLIRGIKKIVSSHARKETINETVAVSGGNANIAPLLERAFIFLEDGNWQEADEYCEKVLDIEPKCAQAYLGKLMAEYKVCTQEKLADCEKSFEDNSNYQRVIRFGDKELVTLLKKYIENINERNRIAELENTYNKALAEMNGANSEESYNAALRRFLCVEDYKNASLLIDECKKKADECRKDNIYVSAQTLMQKNKVREYEHAIDILEQIPGWLEADNLICICKKRIEKIKKREAMLRRICVITIIAFSAIAALTILLNKVIFPYVQYTDAIKLMNSGNYVDAYEKLIALEGYKDSYEQADSIFDDYMKEKFRVTEVGCCFQYGNYEQDNNQLNGKEAIEWLVLNKEEDKMLVVSNNCLDWRQFNTKDVDVTWESSTIRQWLNEEFIKKAFSAEEQLRIISSEINTPNNKIYGTNGGGSTIDRVFLLSADEVNEYFAKDKIGACVTPYAKSKNAYVNDEGYSTWLLRTPGSLQYNVSVINAFDSNTNGIYDYNVRANHYAAIRPAMWIDIGE